MTEKDFKKITSAKNDIVKYIAKLKIKKHRDEENAFIAEGVKLFGEIVKISLKKEVPVKHIIICGDIFNTIYGDVRNAEFLNKNSYAVVIMERYIFEKLTDEQSPQGIICVLEKNFVGGEINYSLPCIILENVQDPSNVGAIMRSAAALSEFNLILAGDCADIYNGKVIRASMGAFFRQNIIVNKDCGELIRKLTEKGYKVYATHLSRDAAPVNGIEFDLKSAVVLGNEGSGITEETLNLCDGNVIIPMIEGAESLNVSAAAAIFLWSMSKHKER